MTWFIKYHNYLRVWLAYLRSQPSVAYRKRKNKSCPCPPHQKTECPLCRAEEMLPSEVTPSEPSPMTHVPDGFGHLVAERPVLFRDGPEGDFSIYGLFSSDPEDTYGAWIGIFIGDPFVDDGGTTYAFLGFGGEAGAIKLALLGLGKPEAPTIALGIIANLIVTSFSVTDEIC